VKIIHLSTSTTGGAAVTARNLASLQEKYGHKSRFVTRGDDLTPGVRIRSKISTFLSFANATNEYGQVTHFSAPSINLKEIIDSKPDVIFIHNWFNLLSEKEIISLTNIIPTVFVTHDARLSTGGCHVTLGCQNNHHGCKVCPAAKIDVFSSLAKKSIDTMVEKLGRYAVVAPSNWLLNEMKASPIIQKAALSQVIRNPIDVIPTNLAFEKNTQKESFKILFAAADLTARYKGLNLFLNSLLMIDPESLAGVNLEIQIVGKGRWESTPRLATGIGISFLGALPLSEVHKLMQASDLLVVPSLSENFPGVISEAQVLGCTVAASRVGGIPEMIEDEVTGFLFEPDSHSCQAAIIRAIQSQKKVNIFAQQQAVIRHDGKRINQEYESLIKELIN
jgi:glycosyltransferase involved in cell wall biosynthesis